MQIIGRREFVDLLDLELNGLEAKIDTGAYTSALHCHDIKEEFLGNVKTLCFKLLDPQHPEYNHKTFRSTSYTKKLIKNSFGEKEERFVIKTRILIAKKKINSSFSLTDRGNMKYPILIGRRLIKGKFMIDVKKIHTGGLTIHHKIETQINP